MLKSNHVTIVLDGDNHDTSFIELVQRYHSVKLVDINSLCMTAFQESLLVIVQVNLNDPKTIRLLRHKMSTLEKGHVSVLFLLNGFNRREIVQANILGATDYVSYPCADDYFIRVMGKMINIVVEQAWSELSKLQESALKVSLKVVEKTFTNAAAGLEVAQEDVKDSCNLIIEAMGKDGLTDWMNAIRQHHNYTYRHSMMVCGYLTSFGMLLGIKKTDLQTLAVGGLLHDIGKSITPLEILDKPARLTPGEWKIMQEHAWDSGNILENNKWDPAMIDIATHHHEKLDGSGYPHGLKGGEVSDLARMAAIADMFSGLIDKRSYKPAMPAEQAIEIMLDLTDELDIPLVKAFRAVVLTDQTEIL